MSVLQELLGPVPVGEFLHRTFSRVPLAMPDRAERYTTHFTEADFARMVEHTRSILCVVHKCPFKNIFTYIAPFQDVLDCGSITFILDLEPDRLPI